jgi:hypothetical protein
MHGERNEANPAAAAKTSVGSDTPTLPRSLFSGERSSKSSSASPPILAWASTGDNGIGGKRPIRKKE